jgi:hypothetical protein
MALISRSSFALGRIDACSIFVIVLGNTVNINNGRGEGSHSRRQPEQTIETLTGLLRRSFLRLASPWRGSSEQISLDHMLCGCREVT